MSNRLTDEEYRARAKKDTRGYDWLDIDEDAEVLNTDQGAFVQAWVLVNDPDEEDA